MLSSWLKALHLVFMVTWFAGLFYLPRLFVYHAMASDPIGIERFKLMERKLYYGIATPGGVLTVLFGTLLIYENGLERYANQGWLAAKLSLVAVLVAYHVYCGKLLADFRADRNRRGHVWYRWFNEFPVLVLVAVMLLAVLKPF
jgi:putative membrane protein